MWLKIQRVSLSNFGAGGSKLTKLLQATSRQAGEITCVQFLEAPPPQKKLGRPKNVQISARFLSTFNFDREYLRNGSTYRTSEKMDQPQPLPRWRKMVNFGLQTKKFKWLIEQPKWTFFWKLHFGH